MNKRIWSACEAYTYDVKKQSIQGLNVYACKKNEITITEYKREKWGGEDEK